MPSTTGCTGNARLDLLSDPPPQCDDHIIYFPSQILFILKESAKDNLNYMIFEIPPQCDDHTIYFPSQILFILKESAKDNLHYMIFEIYTID